jgi:predicted TPR repeat methyltransferase
MIATAEPAEVSQLCDEALDHLDGARFPQALEALARARRIAPDSARIHYCLALYHGDCGNLGEALRALDASLRIDPLNAKAHNNRGSVLLRVDRTTEAEAAFRRAIELDPRLAPPYVNLGHILEQRAANDEAVAVYEEAMAQGLDREVFEQCRAVASRTLTRASPAGWVRDTFDNFAPAFDVRLREIGYRMPEEIARRLAERAGSPLDILDLGCGTGLVGVALAGMKRRMVGIDLSPKMLQYATNRGVYDETHVAEIHEYLRTVASSSFDVVVATDVFIYIGALEEVFVESARILRAGGWFAFSTEEQPVGDYELLPTGRYAQSMSYIGRLAAHDFTVRDAEPAIVRHERGAALGGRIYLLQKNTTAPT